MTDIKKAIDDIRTENKFHFEVADSIVDKISEVLKEVAPAYHEPIWNRVQGLMNKYMGKLRKEEESKKLTTRVQAAQALLGKRDVPTITNAREEEID